MFVNGISNQNFNAYIGKNLQEEIEKKRTFLQTAPNRKRSVSVSKFDEYIKEIKNTASDFIVDINEDNPNQYLLQFKCPNGTTLPQDRKIFRNKDEKSYQYTSLRNGLKILDKLNHSEKHALNRTTPSAKDDFFLIEPMMPTLYSREKREELKQFEADVLSGKYRK